MPTFDILALVLALFSFLGEVWKTMLNLGGRAAVSVRKAPLNALLLIIIVISLFASIGSAVSARHKKASR